jgi:AraC-like DNA-binding protein
MRVFVSSTVYDLLDIRSEIAELLRSLNIQPVLSDDKLSDFEPKFDANSIEACLVNVASSDEVNRPEMDVAEVAFLLGYEDSNSFYRAFRTWEGTTRSQLRAALRRSKTRP